jgi:hypothetical protein
MLNTKRGGPIPGFTTEELLVELRMLQFGRM